jgi:hypothetical protein
MKIIKKKRIKRLLSIVLMLLMVLVLLPSMPVYAAGSYYTIEAIFKEENPLTGTVTISGKEQFGEFLTAIVSGSNNTGTLSYLWTRSSGVGDITTGDTYYVDERFDEGNFISCEVTSSVQTGSISASTGIITGKIISFKDMPEDEFWSTSALKAAINNGLINGFQENNNIYIKPNDSITRAQIATIVNRAFGANEIATLSGNNDMSPSAWYYKDMQKAVKMGTMKLDAKMRPNDNITRQEAFTILGRALKMEDGSKSDLAKFSDASQISDWAAPAMGAMVKAGYIKGDNNLLNPKANMTRAQFAVVMNNAIKDYITKATTVKKVLPGNIMINVAGVTLEDVTIYGDLIIGDGVGDGIVTLNNVIVKGNIIIRGGKIERDIPVEGNTFNEIEQIPSSIQKTVNLYFAGSNAENLEIEERKLNVIDGAIARAVVEALIDGPTQKLFATIPKDTRLLNIYILEGVAYVDFSQEFISNHSGGSAGEIMTLYSIVNTLTDFDTINSVQILIEGKKGETLGNIILDTPIERE